MTRDTAPVESMGLPARIRWRLAWHPVADVLGGAVLGFLLGNVAVTWAVRFAILRGSVEDLAAPLRSVIGSGRAFLLALAVLPVVVIVLGGAICGGLLWLLGKRTVGERGTAVRNALIGTGEGVQLRYVVESGSVPFLPYPERIECAEIDAADENLELRIRQASMPERAVETDQTVTIDYPAVRSVYYDDLGGDTYLETERGTLSIPTGTNPTSLVGLLRDHGASIPATDGSGGLQLRQRTTSPTDNQPR